MWESGGKMIGFIKRNKLSILMFIVMIAVVASTAFYSWLNKPIHFDGAPENWYITRNERFDFGAHNAAEGKRGYRGYMGYFITSRNDQEFHKNIDIISRFMLFDLISDFERAPREVKKYTIDNEDKSIVFDFNALGLPIKIYSYQDDIMAVQSTLQPNQVYYYYVNPDKLTKLINDYIAHVEKMNSDTQESKTAGGTYEITG